MSTNSELHVYADGRAVWRAATDRARALAAATSGDTSMQLRRFVFDRFLARVFAHPTSPWVLKGGSAMLARVHDARTTKDLDLLHKLPDIDAAIDALRVAAATDLGDHFRFVVTKAGKDVGGMAQPNIDGARVSVEAYVGTRKVNGFHVDLATGSLMTADPETRLATSIEVPGLAAPLLRLYPVVDHIADKVCAIHALYGDDHRPSSRYHDLVDLVVFAVTEDIDGAALTKALLGEWAHRHMSGEPRFDPPPEFERSYPPLARRVPPCARYVAYADAAALVSALITPALTGTVAGHRWVGSLTAWQPIAH